MKLKVDKKVVEFFKENTSMVMISEDERYYYYPFWVRFDKDDLMEPISFDHLPPDLRNALKEMRNEINKNTKSRGNILSS